MRARTGKMVLVFLVVLAGSASLATAEFGLKSVVVAGSNSFPEWSTGWQFTPAEDITVTKLGFWAPPSIDGFSYDHVITIYDSTSASMMISGTVVAGILDVVDENGEVIESRRENDYAYVDVSAQNVVLNGGHMYVIASYWHKSNTEWFDSDVQFVSTSSPGSGISLGALDLVNFNGQGMPTPLGGTTNVLLSANFQFEPVPTTVTVQIDIKPGTDPNPINQGSNGVIPVAILTTPEFDAVNVDPATVSLNGAGVAVRGKSANLLARMEDVDGDGDADLLCQIDTECWAGLAESGDVKLMGSTIDGVAIEGWDFVIVVPPLP